MAAADRQKVAITVNEPDKTPNANKKMTNLTAKYINIYNQKRIMTLNTAKNDPKIKLIRFDCDLYSRRINSHVLRSLLVRYSGKLKCSFIIKRPKIFSAKKKSPQFIGT